MRNRIIIYSIPHQDQRYDTVGDWITEEEGAGRDDVYIVVSELPDERMEFLIAVHELIEWFLAKQHGVSAKSVTQYDIQFEDNRQILEANGYSEPGDHPDCPVYHEHRFASAIERLLAHELNVDWREYERAIDKLSHPSE